MCIHIFVYASYKRNANKSRALACSPLYYTRAIRKFRRRILSCNVPAERAPYPGTCYCVHERRFTERRRRYRLHNNIVLCTYALVLHNGGGGPVNCTGFSSTRGADSERDPQCRCRFRRALKSRESADVRNRCREIRLLFG